MDTGCVAHEAAALVGQCTAFVPLAGQFIRSRPRGAILPLPRAGSWQGGAATFAHCAPRLPVQPSHLFRVFRALTLYLRQPLFERRHLFLDNRQAQDAGGRLQYV